MPSSRRLYTIYRPVARQSSGFCIIRLLGLIRDHENSVAACIICTIASAHARYSGQISRHVKVTSHGMVTSIYTFVPSPSHPHFKCSLRQTTRNARNPFGVVKLFIRRRPSPISLLYTMRIYTGETCQGIRWEAEQRPSRPVRVWGNECPDIIIAARASCRLSVPKDEPKSTPHGTVSFPQVLWPISGNRTDNATNRLVSR